MCGFTQELLDNHSTCRSQWGLIPTTQPDVRGNRAISGLTRLPSVLFPRRIRQDGRCFTDWESCQIPIYVHLYFIWINFNGQWYHQAVTNVPLPYIRKSCYRTSNKSMFIASGLASAIAIRGYANSMVQRSPFQGQSMPCHIDVSVWINRGFMNCSLMPFVDI